MSVCLHFKAYSSPDNPEFKKHYNAVKFCIENELSFPKETSEFFRGKVDTCNLEDMNRDFILEIIENGVEVPVVHSNYNYHEIRIKTSDIPSNVSELVIKLQ